jgi:mono/diheme cytochrome c family protein
MVLAATAVSLVAASGCGKGGSSASSTESQGSSPAVAIDATQAKEIFNTRCAACHGTEGLGNGPGAGALNPKPRNYHDRSWQTKVTDAEIRKTITYGGAAVGKSPMMPASPDLEAKPEVIEGLVKIVRDFGKS